LVDASVDGFNVQSDTLLPAMSPSTGVPILIVQDVGEVALDTVRLRANRLTGRFVMSDAQRDAMIRKLFSGAYSNQVGRVQSWRALLRRLWTKAVG